MVRLNRAYFLLHLAKKNCEAFEVNTILLLFDKFSWTIIMHLVEEKKTHKKPLKITCPKYD